MIPTFLISSYAVLVEWKGNAYIGSIQHIAPDCSNEVVLLSKTSAPIPIQLKQAILKHDSKRTQLAADEDLDLGDMIEEDTESTEDEDLDLGEMIEEDVESEDAIEDIDGVISGDDQFTGRVFDAARKLKVVSKWGTGIDCAEAMVWVFNQEEDIVNWPDATNQMKHDFTEHVDYEDIQPGDVGFIDYTDIDSEGNVVAGDGIIDEVFIIIEPRIDSFGDPVNCIRIIPEQGVHFSSTEYINTLYDTGTSFVDYRSLKDTPKGGHSPYPKPKGKPI